MKLEWMFITILLTVLIDGGEYLSSNLDDLQKEYGEWRLQKSPDYPTSIGIYKYNDQVEKYSYSGFDEEYRKYVSLQSRLNSIVYDQLSPKEKTDYDIFNDTLSTLIRGYRWKDYNILNPINFLEGPQIDPSSLPSITPFDTVGDYENYVRRLELYPNQIGEMMSLFNKAIEKGHTYHNVSVKRVPDQIDAILTNATAENFPLYKPFLEKLTNLTTIDESKKADMRERARSAVQNMIQKFRDLKRYFETEYFLHVRSGYGVSSWDKGGEFYKECLRWHLSLDLTPDAVHHKGLQEVERISSEMRKIMMKLNHKGSVKEFFDKIKADPNNYLNTGEEIIQWYKDAIKNDIEPQLPKLFKDLPNLPVDVQPNPIDGIDGQYLAGPPDGSRPGVFQVNVFHPNKSIKIDFMALLLHETIPGHHLQISVASTVQIPSYRKQMTGYLYTVPFEAPFYTAYVEGWALYAESLGEEMNVYKTDNDLMGRYGSEIFRACRLVVDTGLHYFNWTRQRAIDYMLNYTAYSENSITTEIDRYLTWPGQACAYKIGELKIKELRERAKNALGSKFDIRDFHSIVLKDGALPLNILEKNVDQWIAETKNKPSKTTNQCTSEGSTKTANLKMLPTIFILLLLKSFC
ncbi:uncharacterized protein LOC133202364 [Saccostrea echinata]|uniref:uncharacterized protein LOC133202364 n=1 Tax=Saccostrea echinata TaxID=191078 RepID=UPI002A7FEA1A|nr:uncharacterized protein LOC133202364 [Saccostrea echinata]